MFKECVHEQGKQPITNESAIYQLKNLFTSFRNRSEKFIIAPLKDDKILENKEKSENLSKARKEKQRKSIFKLVQANKIRKAIQKSEMMIAKKE